MNELPDLRELVDGEHQGKVVKILCPNPAHDDHDPSCAVYDDGLKCFSCGYSAQGWQAFAILTGEAPDTPVGVLQKQAAARHLRAAPTKPDSDKPERDLHDGPLLSAYAELYHQALLQLRSERQEWLYDRGIKRETIASEKLGHNVDRFVIPIWSADGELLTLRYRMDPEFTDEATLKRRKYCGIIGRNQALVYGEHWLAEEKPDAVVVCEGEFDALLLHQEGIPAITLTNGAGQLHLLPRLLKRLKRDGYLTTLPTILLFASDQDEAGEKAWSLFEAEAKRYGFTTRRLTWQDGKDVTEHWQQTGNVECFRAA